MADPVEAANNWWLIGGLVLAGGFLAGALFFGLRWLISRKSAPKAPVAQRAAAQAPAPMPNGENGAAKTQTATAQIGARPTFASNGPIKAGGAKLNFKRPLGAPANGKAHRRRTFDYDRYFADLLDSVSGRTYAAEFVSNSAAPNAAAVVNGEPKANGSENGTALVQVHADIIANQKSFIEEQRRLIAEQSKLIEEKTRLISEKNQLLKMQSDLIENKLL